MKQRNRHRIIEERLQEAKKKLLQKKEVLENARVEYETTKEEFSAIRRVASEIFTGYQMYGWQNKNQDVQFIGVPIGDAIIDLLRARAQKTADDHIQDSRHNFKPSLTMEQITNLLEDSGFEFRTLTPRREVNAAVRHLKGIERTSSGMYQIADAKGLLQRTKELMEESFEAGFKEETEGT